ncbi:hypothetical protein SPIROBIBN47_250021 [uncultured spirochete]|jgi:hypothetical protein|uniref:Uncharacterized protein n=1 Tax=uncultured spirochete TaxID=156406 RepID=A0A3P3XI61_9SPIR|nr:hypothetical protein SPIROBIBN47_250021 [uncultured spirochete]
MNVAIVCEKVNGRAQMAGQARFYEKHKLGSTYGETPVCCYNIMPWKPN